MGTSLTRLPPIRISPSVGSRRPAIMRRLVVLPQPDGPRSVTNAPSGISSDERCTAVNVPKRLTMLFKVTELIHGLQRRIMGATSPDAQGGGTGLDRQAQ